MTMEPGSVFADLHIHSRYSRATSSELTIPSIYRWAQIKGISLIGTGDFTHPAWMNEIRDSLVERGDGLLEPVSAVRDEVRPSVPLAARRDVAFIICGEISSIFKKNGRTRKVHSLVFMPSLESAARFSTALGRLGNITSDGRPILGLEPLTILRLARDICPDSFMIPAHIWTPHFSVFGAMSGFDSLQECFEDLTDEIFAVETGLSSDVSMNRRWSALDRMTLVSSSDAHSPSKLGREATILEGDVSYGGLVSALRREPGTTRVVGTVEFYPEEGKYHLDGHRKCAFRCDPIETARLGGRCPVCAGRLTPGVLGRVEQLADRGNDEIPDMFPGQMELIPLAEVLSEIQGCGPGSNRVEAHRESVVSRFGSELDVLARIDPLAMEAAGEYALAEAVRRMRSGRVFREAGYDGEFGRIGLFLPGEAASFRGQGMMFGPGSRPVDSIRGRVIRESVEPDLFAPEPDRPTTGLSDAQDEAAGCAARYCMVVAGPGTGKTRTLVERAARLVDGGAIPGAVLVLTFTNRAAGEAAQRLAVKLGDDSCPVVSTFHAFALRELSRAAEAAGDPPPVLIDGAPAMDRDGQVEGQHGNRMTLDELVPSLVEGIRTGRYPSPVLEHILVDEFQDISDDQYQLLDLLGQHASSVFCVGDPDQSIYGFRGAVPAVFERFESDHPDCVRHVIGETYRLTPPVVEVARFVAGRAAGSGAVLRSVSGAGTESAPVVLCAARHAFDEASWIVRSIRELVGGIGMLDATTDAGSCGLGDVAVLGRTHHALIPVARALDEAGIPFETASDAPLWHQAWVQAILAALKTADPARPFPDLARSAIAVAGLVPPARQLSAILSLAGDINCGDAGPRLRLLSEVDAFALNPEKVRLLTMHASKGLEFDNVFVAGLNDGTVPLVSGRDLDEDEERRLLFVAVTRARRRLFLSWAARGRSGEPSLSRFLRGKIPVESLTAVGNERPRPVQQRLL